jgi:hypothetical protein
MMQFFDVDLKVGEGSNVTQCVFPSSETGKGRLFVCAAISFLSNDVADDMVIGLYTSEGAALVSWRNDACYFKEVYDFKTLDFLEGTYSFSFADAYIDERYAFIHCQSTGSTNVRARFWGHFAAANETVSTLLSFSDAQWKT